MLFDNPTLIPVREIDSAYGPLIPLCKELRTAAGSLDLAFIDTRGHLTLVECKLWRNPEARRKVVAQVLDYARAISRWSYADLQRQVASARGEPGNVPFALAQQQESSLIEHQFVDSVANALKAGRFLLLIAGDGIREDVGAITELINRNAAAGFTFGLVEVALYGMEDGALIVQPRTVAKTKLIERTVILVQDAASNTPAFDIFADADAAELLAAPTDADGYNESPRQAAYRTWWTPILEMAFDDPEQEPPKLYWPNNVRTLLPAPKTWILAYRFGNGEQASAGICTAGSQPGYSDLIAQLQPYKNEIMAELPDGTEYRYASNRKEFGFSTERPITDFADDEALREWIVTTINAYVNALRPRLCHRSGQ
jgi:hypothetical protein